MGQVTTIAIQGWQFWIWFGYAAITTLILIFK